jgi:uncharacterized membrane protein
MATFGSREICVLTLSLIIVADVSVLLNVPVLRQVLGFVLLVFLPGFLLIQVIRLKQPPVESALFTLGLSVSFLMFVPFAMDIVYPALGILRPLTSLPLIATFSLILAGLDLLAYRIGAIDFQISTRVFRTLIEQIQSPAVIGAGLILVLGILGGLFVRFDLDSIFSLFSTLSIAIAAILLVATRRVPERLFPLYIVVIALALQYSRTLTSAYLFTPDAHTELFLADLVKTTGYWNPSVAPISSAFTADYYAMLSVTVLPNVYSLLLNVDTTLIYMLVTPFVFAFVPLGIYQLCKTQLKFSSRSAFLSAFFFMSFSVFFYEIPRQEIAELFMILVVLVIVSSYVRGPKKNALLILFIASTIVAHYSTSYILLFYLVVLLIGSTLIGAKDRQGRGLTTISAAMVAIAALFAFGWYVFVSSGGPFIALLDVGSQTVTTFSSELFAYNTEPHAAALLGGAAPTFLHTLFRYWLIATEVLIAIGLTLLIRRRRDMQIKAEFLWLLLATFSLVLVAIALPALAGSINANRLYGLTLLFLAPCCVFGIEAIVDTVSKWTRVNKDKVVKLKYAALLGVLIPYFLFNYGFIFEITEHPSSYAFLPSQAQAERVPEYSLTQQDWSYLVPTPMAPQNEYASTWLSGAMNQWPVYADVNSLPALTDAHVGSATVFTPWILSHPLTSAYVFLGAANVQQGNIIVAASSQADVQQISTYSTLTVGNKVYSNGLAEVYYYP